MQRTRIILVDDHPLVREGLARIIADERDLLVCAQADDAPKALELIGSTEANLAIVDLGLKQSSGLDLIKQIRSRFDDVAVLVVSMFDDSLWAERAIRAGAGGYLNKQEAVGNVVTAIRRVLAGELYLSGALTQRLAARATNSKVGQAAGGVDSLTDRELQVFELVGRGFNSSQIAKRMGISVSTVDTYRDRIKEKLHLADSSELLQHAIAWVHSSPVV